MENDAEKKSSSTEKSNGSYASEQGNPLYDMFVTQLTRLHTVRAKEAIARGFGQANLVRSVGETWFVDPQYGKGSYWFYLMDGDTIVVSMDITYERAVEAAIETVPYLGFGLYEHAMPEYCSPECAGSNCKLIGHDWDGGTYTSSFEPGKRLSSASITIAPKRCTAMRMPCAATRRNCVAPSGGSPRLMACPACPRRFEGLTSPTPPHR